MHPDICAFRRPRWQREPERNGAAIGRDLAGREGLRVDLHRHAQDGHSLYLHEYIVAEGGVQSAFGGWQAQ